MINLLAQPVFRFSLWFVSKIEIFRDFSEKHVPIHPKLVRTTSTTTSTPKPLKLVSTLKPDETASPIQTKEYLEIANKTFAFLIVSCKHKPKYNFINDETKDALWYTFCEEYPDYDRTKLTMFYKSEKTTWAQGRNFLLDQAISNMPSSRSYEYFIFLDDDMLDQMINFNTKIKEFQNWLLVEKPAIGYMRGSSTWMASWSSMGHTNIDPNVAAHHKSTLGLILPMNDEEWLTKASWNYAIWIENIMASMIYPTERIGFMDVSWDYSKAQHTDNPEYDRAMNWHLPTMYLNDAVLHSGEIRPCLDHLHGGEPNNVGRARYMCYRFCEPARGSCIATEKLCENRKVLLNGPPTVDWLLANFDGKHNFTKELLKFHKKHADYLNSIRETEFKPRLLIQTETGGTEQSDY